MTGKRIHPQIIAYVAALANVFIYVPSSSRAAEPWFAPKPLFADPNYHGSCDPEITWNAATGEWLIFYTARRALHPTGTPAAATPIGVATSKDWREWNFKGYCKFDGADDSPDASHTFWAPGIVRDGDMLHMFVTYKAGTNGFWGSEGEGIRHYIASAKSPLDWKFLNRPIVGEEVIDAGFVKRGDEWLVLYRDQQKSLPRGTTIFTATSRDLTNFITHGAAQGDVNNFAVTQFNYQEAPYPFFWRDKYWMLTDPSGPPIAVYESTNATDWHFNGIILDQPGKTPTDKSFGRHPTVAVVGERAFVFFHVEPDRDYSKSYPQQKVEDRKCYLQVAELEVMDGKVVCDRDKPVALPNFSALQNKTSYGNLDATASLQIPADTKPLLDYWMRDTYVTLGPDGFYYLTGTTAPPDRKFDEKGPHCWDWNDGLYLWRSSDLKSWESLGLVWSLDKDATWQKEFAQKKSVRSPLGFMLDAKRRAVWAPELHYIKSATNWFMVACMNDAAPQKGSFILRSTSGKAEGPYENILDNATGPIFNNIDGSLFEDDDGSVWFVGHNHFYAKIKSDMSGFDGDVKQFSETDYSPEPYLEGAYVFKAGGKYHLLQAAWSFKLADGTFTYDAKVEKSGGVRWSYDCIVADAEQFAGPYGPRYTAGMGIGHNNFFQDKSGNWWATMFGNPRGTSEFKQPFFCRPAIVSLVMTNGIFQTKLP